MDKNYTITIEDEVTVIRFHVPATIEDVIRAIHEGADIDTSSRRLWVLENGGEFSGEDLKMIAEVGLTSWKNPSKSAVVVDDDLSFGLARIHEAYRDNPSHENRVFRDEAEARAWLKKPFGT